MEAQRVQCDADRGDVTSVNPVFVVTYASFELKVNVVFTLSLWNPFKIEKMAD